jgi:hypothetical protein
MFVYGPAGYCLRRAATGCFIVFYFERRSLRAREQLLSFALMQKKVTKEKIKFCS